MSTTPNGTMGYIIEEQNPETTSPNFYVQRKAFDQQDFNTAFQAVKKTRPSPIEQTQSAVRSCCSLETAKRAVVSTFPVIDWLGHYNVKRDLVPDLIASFIVAIFNVPQGMAYGMLAGVPPVYGLYTSFYPVFVYFLMGTSRQIATGTDAVTSLMTGAVVKAYADRWAASDNVTTPSATSQPSDTSEECTLCIQVAISICLLSGLYQLGFGIFRLGMLSVYLPEHLVSSFTSACAFHVLTSQLSGIFGIHLKNYEGPLNLIYTYRDFFERITYTNLATLTVSGTTIVILIAVKEFINPRVIAKIRMPIPVELIVVMGATFISYFMELRQTYGVATVGHIPTGLPPPEVPEMKLLPELAGKSVAIAIITFATSLSLSKLYAKKYNYKIDPNQEAIALGAGKVLSAFFMCIPSAGALSRSSLQESLGGRTQLVSLINCCVLLVVLLVAAPLLEKLPTCVLSAIIVVSLKNLLFQVTEFRRYWRVSKVDGTIWILTFIPVIFLNIDLGLGIGVAFGLLTVIYRTQRPKTSLLGCVGNTDVYVPIKKYRAAEEIPGVKIFHFGGPLHFPNTEYFQCELERRIGISLSELAELMKQENSIQTTQSETDIVKSMTDSQITVSTTISTVSGSVQQDGNKMDVGVPVDSDLDDPSAISHIVIDCCGFGYVDTPGVVTLKQVVQDYAAVGISILLAGCPANVYSMLEKERFFDVLSAKHVFPTIHDAILHVLLPETSSIATEEADTGISTYL